MREQRDFSTPPLRATRMIKATNVIYHDKAHSSALTLPIVP